MWEPLWGDVDLLSFRLSFLERDCFFFELDRLVLELLLDVDMLLPPLFFLPELVSPPPPPVSVPASAGVLAAIGMDDSGGSLGNGMSSGS